MHRAHHRRAAGVAALLPALLLAALYVAAPFAGTTTHAIARHTTVTSARATATPHGLRPLAATTAAGKAHPTAATDQRPAADTGPLRLTGVGSALRTMGLWYAGIIAVALAVIVTVTVRRGDRGGDDPA